MRREASEAYIRTIYIYICIYIRLYEDDAAPVPRARYQKSTHSYFIEQSLSVYILYILHIYVCI